MQQGVSDDAIEYEIDTDNMAYRNLGPVRGNYVRRKPVNREQAADNNKGIADDDSDREERRRSRSREKERSRERPQKSGGSRSSSNSKKNNKRRDEYSNSRES